MSFWTAVVVLVGIVLLGAGVTVLVREREPRPAIRVLNGLVLVLFVASYACFATSLFLPAIDDQTGLMCLVFGPLGLVGCVDPVLPWALAWFATPIVLLALPLTQIASGKWHPAGLGRQLLGVGMAAMLVRAPGTMQVWGSGGLETVLALDNGYWAWLASLALFMAASLLLSARQRLTRRAPASVPGPSLHAAGG